MVRSFVGALQPRLPGAVATDAKALPVYLDEETRLTEPAAVGRQRPPGSGAGGRLPLTPSQPLCLTGALTALD